MEHHYHIYGYTIANIGKEKNGDSFFYQFLEKEEVLFASIADGVSRQPCDWLASQTTCQKVWEYFQGNPQESEIGKRLQESVQQANEHILQVEGQCRRMASTLSVLVWPVEQDRFWYVNIGDSRIYRCWEGEFEVLTKDDAILVKERVLAHGGLRVVEKSVLNKVMGQVGITFKVMENRIKEGEVLVLATDGFYDARKAIFSQTMAQLSQQEPFEESCQAMVTKFEMLRGDDLSAIMIKRRVKHST